MERGKDATDDADSGCLLPELHGIPQVPFNKIKALKRILRDRRLRFKALFFYF